MSVQKLNLQSTDLVRLYLHEISQVPLLTPEQEVIYSRQVQRMMLLLKTREALAKKLQRQTSIQEWAVEVHLSEADLSQALYQGQRAKQKMIEANLRLVVMIAKKYQNRGLELMDIVQEGSIGLQRAVEMFDPSHGYRFSTYAYYWCRQGITRALASSGRAIRLPVHVIEKLNQLKQAQRKLSQELGHTPTVNELAVELGLTSQRVQKYLEWMQQQPISLDLLVGNEQDLPLEERLRNSSEGVTVDEHILYSALRDEIKQIMTELTPQEREVLSLRFGLEDEVSLNLATIGQRLHLSRERIRQIERKALKKLRQQTAILALLN